MQTYILRRLLLFIPTLLIVSLIIFSLLRLGQGDPIQQFYGDAASGTFTALSEKEVAELRAFLNLDDPIVVQYGKWIKDVLIFSGTEPKSPR